MRRIFYFFSGGMKVFEWEGSELLGSMEFKADETGLNNFETYLQSSPQKTSQLLVDIIEEDFRRENIPHVNSRDRKALVNRLLDRHYRGETHMQVRMLNRDSSGRRDDQILLSALSNVEQMDPWLSRMNECRVPLSGIWSVPLLMEDFLKIYKYKSENLLIVSRQLSFSQRETFFKNGRLIFSRLEKVEKNLRLSSGAQETVQYLQQGTDQIRHFLTNQRIIGFVEELHVVCLVPDDIQEECENIITESGQIKYEFVGLGSLYESQKILECKNHPADTLISWLCTRKNVFSDHYGTRKQKKTFYSYAIDKSIDMVAGLMAMLFITAAVLLWLDGADLTQQVLSANEGKTILERRYYQEFGASEHKLDDAYTIQNIVSHAAAIKLESSETLHKYFPVLGSVYSRSDFSPVSLDEMHWMKYPRNDVKQAVKDLIGKRSAQDDEYDESGGYYEEVDTGILTTRLQPVVKLVGKLDRSALSYRDTVLVMRKFVDALLDLQPVSEIHLISTPVDIRPDARFSDKGGLDQDNYAKNDNADTYEILLVMEPGGSE